jgi:SMODS-associated NUDIX domain
MAKTLLKIFFGLVIFVWAQWFATDVLRPELWGLFIGVSGSLIIDFVNQIVEQRFLLKLYWDCYKPWARPELRLTLAYLFNIEVNGRYLLVKSNRIENTYQPVGGVYKYFNPEAKNDLDSIGALTDTKIGSDETSEFDLRLNLQNRKALFKFLKWFFDGDERESSPWREFYEELIDTGLLPKDQFPYIHHQLVGQYFEPIHWDKFFLIDTFKYVDIYKPKLINESQLNELKRLLATESDEYIWVTIDEIKQGKSNKGHLIAEHTHKIFKTQKIKL